jgi:hypothetical protein
MTYFILFISKELMFPYIPFENYTAVKIHIVCYDTVYSLVGEY